MTALSQTILEKFQVRKTKKQKLAFISLLKEHFPELQVQEGGFPKNRNLIFGDIETAKVLVTAHYDTCAQLPFPNMVMPKSPLMSILYSVIICIPFIIAVFLLNFMMHMVTQDSLLIYCVTLALSLIALMFLYFGPANKHTANDNTSGVIALVELMGTLTEAERSKAAFVFFDNEEIGLLGSSYFRSKYKKVLKDKLLINFDCISDGDHIMVAVSKAARTDVGQEIDHCFLPKNGKSILISKAEKVYYPSDQLGFRKHIVIVAMRHKPRIGYYIDKIHTKHDTAFDKANISLICRSTLKLLKKQV